jgi:hypothetical protein
MSYWTKGKEVREREVMCGLDREEQNRRRQNRRIKMNKGTVKRDFGGKEKEQRKQRGRGKDGQESCRKGRGA